MKFAANVVGCSAGSSNLAAVSTVDGFQVGRVDLGLWGVLDEISWQF